MKLQQGVGYASLLGLTGLRRSTETATNGLSDHGNLITWLNLLAPLRCRFPRR
jgi:hypothetical protein